jgi:hypothetical protein
VVLGFDSRRGLGNFLFTTASRAALGPTQPPIRWVPGALSLGVKRPGREADHSPPSSADVKERVALYIPSPPTPPAKLIVTQLVKKLPAFYGTHRFITQFTTARNWPHFRSGASSPIPPIPIFLRSILISYHLRLDLASDLLLSDFPTKIL